MLLKKIFRKLYRSLPIEFQWYKNSVFRNKDHLKRQRPSYKMKSTILSTVALMFLCVGIYASDKCKPLKVDFCSSLGYSTTHFKNLVEEVDQTAAQNDINFKDFLKLNRMGCSRLVKPLACSIYAPPCLDKYGYLPPCRSFCITVSKQCHLFIKAYKSLHGRGEYKIYIFFNFFSKSGCSVSKKFNSLLL